jgi:hypothetical protein
LKLEINASLYIVFIIIVVLRCVGIVAPLATNGVLGTLMGSAVSNLTIYNSAFQSNGSLDGVSGSSSENTLGGVVYIGSADVIELENDTFQQISSVASGGGFYVDSAGFVNVENCLFNQIDVRVSGGFFFFFFFVFVEFFFFLFIFY